MAKEDFEFVFIEDFDKEKFPQYASMTPSERRSLPAVNFWRMKNKMEPIPVPEQDRHYWHYFRSSDQVNYLNRNTDEASPKE